MSKQRILPFHRQVEPIWLCSQGWIPCMNSFAEKVFWIMKLRLMILFILDTLVLVLLTYFLLSEIESGADLLCLSLLIAGVALSITAFLLLFYKFMRLPVHPKKPKL